MRIDLNADVAETEGDVALLEVITSANICCGAYAGSADLMQATCEAAVEQGVTIGAQVGYEDRDNFGRAPMDPPTATLVRSLRRQIDELAMIADSVGGHIAYVKPHGALYHATVTDERQASAVVESVAPYGLALLGLPHAVSLQLAAAAGLPTITEGFADRGYRSDGSLIPRGEPGALLETLDEMTAQARDLLGRVTSICIHGDGPHAALIARRVRQALEEAGAEVGPFAQ
jgi:UPF0271 protein